MVALDDKMASLRLVHHDLMKRRYEQLNWEFSDENFYNWYDNSKYAAKAVCEKLR